MHWVMFQLRSVLRMFQMKRGVICTFSQNWKFLHSRSVGRWVLGEASGNVTCAGDFCCGEGGGHCNGPCASPGSLVLKADLSQLMLALPAQSRWKYLRYSACAVPLESSWL